jgi:hypothetical protein
MAGPFVTQFVWIIERCARRIADTDKEAAVMKMFDRIAERMGHKKDDSAASDSPGATPADQWTVPGVSFDTSGWQLTAATPATMTWTASSAILTLTKDAVPADHAPATLTALREQLRAEARARGEDIVLVEVVETAAGQVLQTIYKRREGPGSAYRSVVKLHQGPDRFQVTTEMDEGNFTGTREALVNAMVAQTGELVLGDTKPDGSRTIKGWFQDAYDPAFDAGALNSYTDDERVDLILPAHPLSRTRAWLATLGSTLTSAGGNAGQALVLEEHPAPARGPRRLLSETVMRGLYRAIGRIDLVEQSLREEIASCGDDPSVRLAGCLLQLGIVLDEQELPREALPVLARAEGLFEALTGADSVQSCTAATHHARVLATLGRPAEALPRFRRAINAFEQAEHEILRMLALAGAGDILAERDDEEEQREGERYHAAAQTLIDKFNEQIEQRTSR